MVPILERQALERPRPQEPRVVDQDVARTEAPLHLVGRRADACAVGGVAFDRERAAAAGAERRGNRLAIAAIAIEERGDRAGADHRGRDRAADAARYAGHHADAAREAEPVATLHLNSRRSRRGVLRFATASWAEAEAPLPGAKASGSSGPADNIPWGRRSSTRTAAAARRWPAAPAVPAEAARNSPAAAAARCSRGKVHRDKARMGTSTGPAEVRRRI